MHFQISSLSLSSTSEYIQEFSHSFESLPSELVAKILYQSNLDRVELGNCYKSLSLLSKNINKIMEGDVCFWLNNYGLTISRSKGKSLAEILAFAQENGSKLRRLKLIDLQPFGDEDLKELISLCPNLKTLILEGLDITADGISHICALKNLKVLDIQRCSKLQTLPSLHELSTLQRCNIIKCNNLIDVSPLADLTELQDLSIAFCAKITETPNFQQLGNLVNLAIQHCPKLVTVHSFDTLANLYLLNLNALASVESLPSFDQLTRLEVLQLTRCEKILEFPSFGYLSQLRELDLSDNDEIEFFPELNGLIKLEFLRIKGCYSLSEYPSIEGLENLSVIELD